MLALVHSPPRDCGNSCGESVFDQVALWALLAVIVAVAVGCAYFWWRHRR